MHHSPAHADTRGLPPLSLPPQPQVSLSHPSHTIPPSHSHSHSYNPSSYPPPQTSHSNSNFTFPPRTRTRSSTLSGSSYPTPTSLPPLTTHFLHALTTEIHSVLFSGDSHSSPSHSHLEDVHDLFDRFYDDNVVYESPLVLIEGREGLKRYWGRVLAGVTKGTWSEIKEVGEMHSYSDHLASHRVILFTHILHIPLLPFLAPAHEEIETPVSTPGHSPAHSLSGGMAGMAFSPMVERGHPSNSTSGTSGMGYNFPVVPKDPTAPTTTTQNAGESSASASSTQTPSRPPIRPTARSRASSLSHSLRSRLPSLSSLPLLPHVISPRTPGTSTAGWLSIISLSSILHGLTTLSLRVTTRLVIDEAGRVVRHEDSTGVRDVLEGLVPGVGRVGRGARRSVGGLVTRGSSSSREEDESATTIDGDQTSLIGRIISLTPLRALPLPLSLRSTASSNTAPDSTTLPMTIHLGDARELDALRDLLSDTEPETEPEASLAQRKGTGLVGSLLGMLGRPSVPAGEGKVNVVDYAKVPIDQGESASALGLTTSHAHVVPGQGRRNVNSVPFPGGGGEGTRMSVDSDDGDVSVEGGAKVRGEVA